MNTCDGQAITLTGEEAALARQALAACPQLPALAHLPGGPGRPALAGAARQAGDGRPAGQVHYDVSLAGSARSLR